MRLIAVQYRHRRGALPRVALCAWALLGAAAVQAQDGVSEEASPPGWTVGGFATVGVTHSNQGVTVHTGSYPMPVGAGDSRAWSAEVDTRLGLQLDARLGPAWSATLQLVSERTVDGRYRPEVEWANVKYQATPDLSLRLGRAALPLFLAGDYRKAGYALPWVRPPVELYDAMPIGRSDGIDLSYRWQALGMNQHSQVLAGRTSVSLRQGKRAVGGRALGVSHTATWDQLTLRATLLSSDITADLTGQLFDGLRAFSPQGAALAARYEIRAKRARMVALGFNYDTGAWFLMGEAGQLKADSMLGDKRAGYLSAGYRYRELTPYVTVSGLRAQMDTSRAGLDLAGLPAQQAATGTALNQGLNWVLASFTRQHTVAAGVRWDVRENWAFKLQYDRITPDAGSRGSFLNVPRQFRPARPTGVASVALDFVF